MRNRMNILLPGVVASALAVLACIQHAAAMDVVRYEVYKGQLFTQSGTNPPGTWQPTCLMLLTPWPLPSFLRM